MRFEPQQGSNVFYKNARHARIRCWSPSRPCDFAPARDGGGEGRDGAVRRECASSSSAAASAACRPRSRCASAERRRRHRRDQPAWDVYGVGIIQPGNAIRALDALGLAEQAVAPGLRDERRSRFHDSQGNLLGEVPALDLLGPRYPAMNGFTRPRLHAILQEAVKRVRSGHPARHDGRPTFARGRWRRVLRRHGRRVRPRRRRRRHPLAGPEPRLRRTRLSPSTRDRSCWRYNVPRPEGLETLDMFVGANGKAGLRAARAGPDVHALHREPPARADGEAARRQARGDLPRAARRVRRPGRRGARPLHHRRRRSWSARSSRCSSRRRGIAAASC